MNAVELLVLAERVAKSDRIDLGSEDFGRVGEEMIRCLWGLAPDRQREVIRLARRGRIFTGPGENAVLADDPEWAAATRLVCAYLRSTGRDGAALNA
jgi:hypothetical protein